jgi:hypothetical protein
LGWKTRIGQSTLGFKGNTLNVWVGWLKSNRPKAPTVLGAYPRFLNEPGQRAIKPLQQDAVREIELDVHIEMLAALDRIEGGRKTQRPMWIQIANPFLLCCRYSNHCSISQGNALFAIHTGHPY